MIDTETEGQDVPGVLAAITGELALNDVTIRQLASVGPGRVMILVSAEDALKSYQALEGLAKGQGRQSDSSSP